MAPEAIAELGCEEPSEIIGPKPFCNSCESLWRWRWRFNAIDALVNPGLRRAVSMRSRPHVPLVSAIRLIGDGHPQPPGFEQGPQDALAEVFSG
jgi:hypothetical protein